jgi:hypothetical protein
MDTLSNSRCATLVAEGNERLLEWMDPHFNSRWPTLVAQGNGGLLE